MPTTEPRRIGVSIELKPHAYDPVASPELFEGVPVPVMRLAYARPISVDDRTRRIIRNAKQNCIALFVCFVLGLMPVFSTFATMLIRGGGAGAATSGIVGLGACIVPIGTFAAIYLPVRWRFIMELPSAYKVLGLIGGFGFMGLLALYVLGGLLGIAP